MQKCMIILVAALLAACGKSETKAPQGQVQDGIDRAVADVRAAEAATGGPVVQSRSVAELTGTAKTPGETDQNGRGENGRGKGPAKG